MADNVLCRATTVNPSFLIKTAAAAEFARMGGGEHLVYS